MTLLEKLIEKHGTVKITKNYNSHNLPDWTSNDLQAAVFDTSNRKLLVKNNLKTLISTLLQEVMPDENFEQKKNRNT